MNLDWETIGRVARAATADVPGQIEPTALQARGADAAARVIEVTGMEPQVELPAVEWTSRSEWVDANLLTMRSLIEPVVAKAPEPKGGSQLASTVATAAVALEIGALMGMLSRRVLGQLEIDLLDPDCSPRLLMVAPNLEAAVVRMDVPRDSFIDWVLMHEITHAVQFTSVPWLRDELGRTVRELTELADVRLDLRSVLRVRGRELRAFAGSLRSGGLIGAVAGPRRRALIERMQGTMGLVEGHAEWAMDAAGADALPDVERLRQAMDRRRAERAPMLKLLDRLLGFDLKLRQYQQGKVFCDAVVASRGRAGLLEAWASPAAAPTVAELADPALWLGRAQTPA